jgi:hypothetical protein
MKALDAGKVLGGDDLSELFGLEMAQEAVPEAPAAKPARAKSSKKVAVVPIAKVKARAKGGDAKGPKVSSASHDPKKK